MSVWPTPPQKRVLSFKPDPLILTHPNVPPPLHGVAPRVVMGQAWWDMVRKEAYARHGQRCHACGEHRHDVKGSRKHLEAHENYEIDYERGTVTFLNAVALCPYCHRFIHTGRLFALWEKREVGTRYALTILDHGFYVLGLAGAQDQAFWFTHVFYSMLTNRESYEVALERARTNGLLTTVTGTPVEWGAWRLIIGDREFGPKFESQEAWAEHYDAQDNVSEKRASALLDGA